MKYIILVLTGILLVATVPALAQQPQVPDAGAQLDSLRKLEEEGRDTVIFNATYIRYTTLGLLKDSTQTFHLDTTLHRFQNYNVLNRPESPTAHLGNLGLPYRELLFNPSRRIGFDVGFHSLDRYLLTQDSIKYYRARTPFTSLYYVNGSRSEQVFRVIHSQNIKPNWNVGANYYRVGARGIYRNQNSDHLNAAIFSWYESPSKRYNLLVNGLFNNIKAEENGSVVNDSIFTAPSTLGAQEETVRLNSNDPVRQRVRHDGFFLKQLYYIGRIDSMGGDTSVRVLPTQRLSHQLHYSKQSFQFRKNESDPYGVFPDVAQDSIFVQDLTELKTLSNELMYSFYLRGRSVSFIKNEMKLDVGLQHDLHTYTQSGFNGKNVDNKRFQNITLKANAGYRFSDRVTINANLQQIVQGENFGDFLYDAKAQFALSRSVGRIILGAYSLNQSPARIYDKLNYTYHQWEETNFDKTKINNLSFAYLNDRFRINARAEYFLMNNYLYMNGTALPNEIVPAQESANINLLKLTLGKHFVFGKFNFEAFAVYQKTDFQDLLRIPEFYTYNSFYYGNSFFKKAFTANLGFDVRMNTTYTAPSYAINVSQFYNGYPVEYSSYPIVDVWARFALRRANVFVRYDYANQGLFSQGYYTVNRYPMPSALFKFGVMWNFYD